MRDMNTSAAENVPGDIIQTQLVIDSGWENSECNVLGYNTRQETTVNCTSTAES
jgi:hypothetical protein